MKSAKIHPQINKYRLETGAKGFVSRKELPIYAGVGDRRGRELYTAIADQIRGNGKIPLPYGLSVGAVNEYLGLNQQEIERLAAAGY